MRDIGVAITAEDIAGDPAALEAALDRAIAAGATHAEIDAAGFSCLVAGEAVDWLWEPFASVLESRPDLSLVFRAPDLSDLGDEAAGSARGLTGTVELAARAGVPMVVARPTAWRSPHAKRVQKANLTEATWLAKASGVRVLLETRGEVSPADLRKDIEWMGVEVGVMANIGALGFHHGSDAAAMVEEALPYLERATVYDNCGIPFPAGRFSVPVGDAIAMGWGELGLPPGAGQLPLESILAPLSGQSIPTTLALLPRYAWTAARSIEALRGMLGD